MARGEADGVTRTLQKMGALRRRVREARTARTSIRINNAFEYDIIQQGLELLMGTITASHLLSNEERNDGSSTCGG